MINFFGGKKTTTTTTTTTKVSTSTPQASKVVVTKTLVPVQPTKERFRSNASSSTSTHRDPPPSSSSHSHSSSSNNKRKQPPPPRARSPDSPPKPKARKVVAEKKRSTGTPVQRVLAAEDSSSDEEERPSSSGGSRKPSEGGGGAGRARSAVTSRAGTPSGGFGGVGERVVERDVQAHELEGRRPWKGLIHSEDVVKADSHVYRPFFTGEGADEDDQPTRITLQYPVRGASERFVLLSPKVSDGEYDPIQEIARIIRTVLENFLPPPASTSAAPSPLPFSAPSPIAIPPSPLNPSHFSLPTPPSAPVPTPTPTTNPSSPRPPPPSHNHFPSSSIDDTPTESSRILRLLTRSTAPNILSLPLFLEAVTRYNALIYRALESGEIQHTVKNMKGLKAEIWGLIGEQVYQRVVGPKTESLSNYRPFSDNVYGELTPKFTSLIASQTSLSPCSTFVDLGSGVANCVLQIALQIGCASYGCEQLSGPAALARGQVAEAKRRWALWGLKGGSEVEAWEGDFCELREVARVLPKADVVICNNYAFSSQLNEKLSLLFLDLKEGAQIISLRPFVNSDFRLNERTSSSPQAILSVKEYRFSTQAVSWTHEGGIYYIQTVDRRMLRKYLEKTR
ncbi:histone methylation protein DOT1-domain-containing protein [Mrakia frigida]|uniref:histone methyltransferase DOT1 n=1 Tax=Mrakia frigida TaxID=29902 RepID=UPI003FCBF068